MFGGGHVSSTDAMVQHRYSPYMYDYGDSEDPLTGERNITVYPLWYAMVAITRLFESDNSYIFRANVDTGNPLIKVCKDTLCTPTALMSGASLSLA